MHLHQNFARMTFCALALAVVGLSSARAAPVSCSAFRDSFQKATVELKSDFVRPLTVTRNGSEKDDVFDLVGAFPETDAVLTCRGEALERFEANLVVPADATKLATFSRIQKAAIMAAFKWPDARAESVARKINSEAEEYLKASIERGDVVYEGKTEVHQGGGGLGMMYTQTRRTFVVVGDE